MPNVFPTEANEGGVKKFTSIKKCSKTSRHKDTRTETPINVKVVVSLNVLFGMRSNNLIKFIKTS